MKRCLRERNCVMRLDLTNVFVFGCVKRVDFFSKIFPQMPLEKTTHMEGGRRRFDADDIPSTTDDDDEICDQKRSRVARWALEEVRRRVRERGFFVAKHFKKLTPKTNLSLRPCLFSFRAVLPVFLPSVRERGGRGTGKMPVAEKQR